MRMQALGSQEATPNSETRGLWHRSLVLCITTLALPLAHVIDRSSLWGIRQGVTDKLSSLELRSSYRSIVDFREGFLSRFKTSPIVEHALVRELFHLAQRELDQRQHQDIIWYILNMTRRRPGCRD